MEEIWKDIEGYEGFYQVSDIGRVRSVNRFVFNKANGTDSLIQGKIMYQDHKNKSYSQIALAKNGKYKKFLIHRLVAKAFIPNPENKMEVNHINHDKLDNRICNLEWVTRKENAGYAKKMGRYDKFPRGTKKTNNILSDDAVRHIRSKKLRNIDYCRLYKVKPSTVSCLQNTDKYPDRWSHVR